MFNDYLGLGFGANPKGFKSTYISHTDVQKMVITMTLNYYEVNNSKKRRYLFISNLTTLCILL